MANLAQKLETDTDWTYRDYATYETHRVSPYIDDRHDGSTDAQVFRKRNPGIERSEQKRAGDKEETKDPVLQKN